MSDQPFNPLDVDNLAKAVADHLLLKHPVPLGLVPDAKGAGVYAIYYHGRHPAYRAISVGDRVESRARPIYVGKAIPAGGRKGGRADGPAGTALRSRLREHAESIRDARASLDIDDFTCRFAVVDDIWIPLAENLLLARFSPVWNVCIDGFGNHDPGSGRYNQLRSKWDVLHPGRPWAERCKPREGLTEDMLIREVANFLTNITGK